VIVVVILVQQSSSLADETLAGDLVCVPASAVTSRCKTPCTSQALGVVDAMGRKHGGKEFG
jgi:hypothetical protein